MTVEQTTPDDVKAAERAAKDAQELALSLEKQIAAGDMSITRDQLENQRAEARFAVLRVAGVKRNLAEWTDPARLAAVAALREEVDAHAAVFGPRQAELLQTYLDALDAWKAAVQERTDLVVSWYQRADKLRVPHSGGRGTAQNSGLALSAAGNPALLVDGRPLTVIDDQYLDHVRRGSADRSVFLANLRAFDGGDAA